jgi:CheY-like chemotaxis protein
MIDDEIDLLDNVIELLEYEGYSLVTARDGKEELKLASQQPPDLIITDLVMPKLDGLGVLKRLKTDPATASIPVVVVSACTERELIHKTMERGAIHFLVKPFLPGDLLSTIAICLNGRV